MTTEQKTITVLRASEGKELRRKSDGTVYGETVWLGYNHYVAGVRVEPTPDTADDFEEVDKAEKTEPSADVQQQTTD